MSATDSSLNDAISPVLGRVPSGVFILIGANNQGQQTGMLASWVQQASFDPPAVTFAVNAKRYIIDWLKENPQVTLNLVGASQSQFLKHFGRGFEPDQPAFEGVATETGASGLPVLSEAMGYLECEVVSQMESGDHVVYLANITGAKSGESLADEQPMVHIRKSGFGY